MTAARQGERPEITRHMPNDWTPVDSAKLAVAHATLNHYLSTFAAEYYELLQDPEKNPGRLRVIERAEAVCEADRARLRTFDRRLIQKITKKYAKYFAPLDGAMS